MSILKNQNVTQTIYFPKLYCNKISVASNLDPTKDQNKNICNSITEWRTASVCRSAHTLSVFDQHLTTMSHNVIFSRKLSRDLSIIVRGHLVRLLDAHTISVRSSTDLT